jgi:hypothetical protein
VTLSFGLCNGACAPAEQVPQLHRKHGHGVSSRLQRWCAGNIDITCIDGHLKPLQTFLDRNSQTPSPGMCRMHAGLQPALRRSGFPWLLSGQSKFASRPCSRRVT